MTLSVLKIRLCPGDAAAFGCDRDLVLDMEALKDLDAAELEAIDKALQAPLGLFLPFFERMPSAGGDPAQAQRAAIWVALRLAGVDVAWDVCKPRLLRAEWSREEAGDPPAGTSEPSSEDAPPATS